MSHLSYVIVMNKRKSTFCAEKFGDQKFVFKFRKYAFEHQLGFIKFYFIRFPRQNRKFKFVKKDEKTEILPHRKKYFSSGVLIIKFDKVDGSTYQFGNFECNKIYLIPDNEGFGVFLPIHSFV